MTGVLDVEALLLWNDDEFQTELAALGSEGESVACLDPLLLENALLDVDE